MTVMQPNADYDALHRLPPLVEGVIRTRHPDHYLLVNESDGTRWRLGPDGHWIRDLPPEVCSTCGGSFDSPPCSLNRELGLSGHTRAGGAAAADTRVSAPEMGNDA